KPTESSNIVFNFIHFARFVKFSRAKCRNLPLTCIIFAVQFKGFSGIMLLEEILMKRSNAKLYFLILGVSFLVTISCMVAMTHSSMRVIYFGIRHDLSMLSLTSQISSLL